MTTAERYPTARVTIEREPDRWPSHAHEWSAERPGNHAACGSCGQMIEVPDEAACLYCERRVLDEGSHFYRHTSGKPPTLRADWPNPLQEDRIMATKRRRLVLQVEMELDEWTAKAAGSDESIMDTLREDLGDSYLGGAIVAVRRLASTEKDMGGSE